MVGSCSIDIGIGMVVFLKGGEKLIYNLLGICERWERFMVLKVENIYYYFKFFLDSMVNLFGICIFVF